MRLRVFTERGQQGYREFLGVRRGDLNAQLPSAVLSGSDETIEIANVEIDLQRKFSSRWDFGEYICNKLGPLGRDRVSEDANLWDWLGAAYFTQIAPNGKKLRQSARYQLDIENRLTWHRHSVRTNWDLVDAHGAASKWLLTGALHKLGDEIEGVASRKYLVSNRHILEAGGKLFLEDSARRPRLKRGVRDTETATPGTIRRFIVVLQQLERNWDVHSMSSDEILKLLPSEFSC